MVTISDVIEDGRPVIVNKYESTSGVQSISGPCKAEQEAAPDDKEAHEKNVTAWSIFAGKMTLGEEMCRVNWRNSSDK
jgi:hypothetical protein